MGKSEEEIERLNKLAAKDYATSMMAQDMTFEDYIAVQAMGPIMESYLSEQQPWSFDRLAKDCYKSARSFLAEKQRRVELGFAEE